MGERLFRLISAGIITAVSCGAILVKGETQTNPCIDLTPEEHAYVEPTLPYDAHITSTFSAAHQKDIYTAVVARKDALVAYDVQAPRTVEDTYQLARDFLEELAPPHKPGVYISREGDVQARNFRGDVYICGHPGTEANLYYLIAHELAHETFVRETNAEIHALETLAEAAPRSPLAERALLERLEIITAYAFAYSEKTPSEAIEFFHLVGANDTVGTMRFLAPQLYQNRIEYDIIPLTLIFGDAPQAAHTRAYLETLVESIK